MRLREFASNAVSPFAHLMGMTPKAKTAKAEGDDKSDEKEKDSNKAEDKKPPENDKERGSAETEKDDEGVESQEDKDKAAAASAEAEGADDDNDDKDEKDDKKKKEDAKAEKAERTELNGEDKASQARDRERARCRAIFASSHATGRPVVAANLAFDTLMTASEAIKVMQGMGPVPVAEPKAGKAGLDARMAATATPNPGDATGSKENHGDGKMTAAKIIAAGDKARGIVPKAK